MAQLQLTFDDGPQPVAPALSPILQELRVRRVIAAFFNLGQEVAADPAACKTIQEAGHVLANHSWDHLMPNTAQYSDAAIVKQFQDTHQAVLSATAYGMRHWRAPRGEAIERLTRLLTTGPNPLYRLSHADWHADSKDAQGANDAAAMLAALRADIAAHPGRTVFRLLFHVKPTTATALPAILNALTTDGHTFINFNQTA